MTLVEMVNPKPRAPMQKGNYAAHSVVTNICNQEESKQWA